MSDPLPYDTSTPEYLKQIANDLQDLKRFILSIMQEAALAGAQVDDILIALGEVPTEAEDHEL